MSSRTPPQGGPLMLRIRSMTNEDLAFGLALSRQVGWNQTQADWRRCLDLEPDGCFVALLDGAPAGTATTCVFGPVAWVAMVLVDPALRRRGVGRALMAHALNFLDEKKVPTVRLDATPLGRPLYEQLGFVAQFELARFEGLLPAASAPPSPGVVTVPAARWPELVALDEAVARTSRGKLLRGMLAERPEDVRGVEGAGGWRGLIAAREGARARQIGPCLGDAGAVLLEDACRRHAGHTVYLDVPEGNAPATALA